MALRRQLAMATHRDQRRFRFRQPERLFWVWLCTLWPGCVDTALEDGPDGYKADNHYEQSMQLAQERLTRPDLSIVHFRYAECLHKKGDLDPARERLDQAENLFRDMGMDWGT